MTGSIAKRHAFRVILAGLFSAASIAWPACAQAWNAAGHRLSAAIAWDNLDPGVRDKVAALLLAHPDHERWLRRAGPEKNARNVFIEASTWPDEIRKDRRFYSPESEAPTPPLAGFPDMERHRDWHYVNIPLDGSPDAPPLSGQLDRRLPELFMKVAASPDGLERSYALPWLIHLVGDAHQPLHTCARTHGAERWDFLGNVFEVSNPFDPRKPVSTLHAFWDDLPGPPGLRGERLDEAARTVIADHPQSPNLDRCRKTPRESSRPAAESGGHEASETAVETAVFACWIRESWEIARKRAYPPSDDAVPVITETFFQKSRKIAEERVAQAGYRLAGLLNAALGPENRSQR